WPYVFMTGQMLCQWRLAIEHESDSELTCALLGNARDQWGERIQSRTEAVRFRLLGQEGVSLEDYQDSAEAWSVGEGLNPRHLWLREYEIEPDASAASYFFAAAAITGGRVTVPGLKRKSLQGDVRFAEILAQMGCDLLQDAGGLTVEGGPLTGIDV